jgi:signal transduction histidine kinase
MRIKNKILSLWPTSIRQQIFLSLILLTSVPLIILGVLLTDTSQRAVKDSVLRDHREIAIQAAAQVNEFIVKPRELLVMVASIIGVMHTNAWHQETAIVELALRYPMFRKIISIDLNGNEVAAFPLGNARNQYTDHQAFLNARKGETYVSPVKIIGNDLPVITIAVPITKMGQVNGVLLAEINLREMWDIVDRIHIGREGYACVIDRSGAIISHPNKKKIASGNVLANNFVIAQVLEGKSGGLEIRDGKESLMASYASVTSCGWGLVVFQPVTEAYAFSKIMMAQSWIFMLLSILAAFFISSLTARAMSRPLYMLLEGTRDIAQNEFDRPLPIRRHDEIGQILRSFNGTMAKLKSAQQTEKLSIVGKAATSIAHELKNSLTLVDTYLQLLKDQHQDPAFVKEFIHVVPQEISAWKQLLRNMGQFVSVQQAPFNDIDLNSVIKDAAIMVERRITQCGAKFSLITDPRPMPIRGNSAELRQVIVNLVTNALEAAGDNGSIKISTSLIPEDDLPAVFCVYNSGKIIPTEKINRIFEPFFTTKDGGLGLGLPICHEIVKKHQGRIDVVSTESTGTVFKIRLPLRKGAPDVL